MATPKEYLDYSYMVRWEEMADLRGHHLSRMGRHIIMRNVAWPAEDAGCVLVVCDACDQQYCVRCINENRIPRCSAKFG